MQISSNSRQIIEDGINRIGKASNENTLDIKIDGIGIGLDHLVIQYNKSSDSLKI